MQSGRVWCLTTSFNNNKKDNNNNNICSGGQVLEKAMRSRRESVGCSVGSSLTQAAFGQQSNLGGRATKFSKAPITWLPPLPTILHENSSCAKDVHLKCDLVDVTLVSRGEVHQIAFQLGVSLHRYLPIHLPIDVHRAVFTPWTKLQLPFLYFCLGNGETWVALQLNSPVV